MNLELLASIEHILTGWQIHSPKLSKLLTAGKDKADCLRVTHGNGAHTITPARMLGSAAAATGDPAIQTTGYLGGMPAEAVTELAKEIGEELGLRVVSANLTS